MDVNCVINLNLLFLSNELLKVKFSQNVVESNECNVKDSKYFDDFVLKE